MKVGDIIDRSVDRAMSRSRHFGPNPNTFDSSSSSTSSRGSVQKQSPVSSVSSSSSSGSSNSSSSEGSSSRSWGTSSGSFLIQLLLESGSEISLMSSVSYSSSRGFRSEAEPRVAGVNSPEQHERPQHVLEPHQHQCH